MELDYPQFEFQAFFRAWNNFQDIFSGIHPDMYNIQIMRNKIKILKRKIELTSSTCPLYIEKTSKL